MRSRQIQSFTIALVSATLFSACSGPGKIAQTRSLITAKIIAFNDYHGNLESPGSFGETAAVAAQQRVPVGGAEFLAAHVARLKSQNPNNVVVGAGDFIGASPLISAAFFDEPSVETLNRIGVEFNAVGNHEFDKGAEELLRLQRGGCRIINGKPHPNSCKGATVGTPAPYEGARFQWLSANVISTASGKPLLPAYGVKSFDGVKVAFIGMTLKSTPGIARPSGVAGLEFRDEAQTVNALVPELRAQGIESIVVLVHQGGVQTGALADINGCEGALAGSPIADIVGQLDDAVDLVISGHTHAAYNCRLPNAAGRSIPVSSASSYGRVLTDIDVKIDPTSRDIVDAAVVNRLVTRNDPALPADPEVTHIVDGYRKLVAPIARTVVGSIARELPNARVDAACNMPAGNLIADAQLAATAPRGIGGASIAFMNGGGVRAPGFVYAQRAGEGDGNVTYGEAFTAQPFGNNLVTMTLTAQQIKDVLEEQFAGCRGQSPDATRFMLPSAGFHYQWNGAKACDARISNVTLTAGRKTETLVNAKGVVLHPSKTYRVTVNSFMADGGDGYSTFTKGADRLVGVQDMVALTLFMNRFRAPQLAYDPIRIAADRRKPRLRRIGGTTCPTEANPNP